MTSCSAFPYTFSIDGGLATIVVGLAAVVVAAWVGKRTVAIYERQADIMASQTKLAQAIEHRETVRRSLELYGKAKAFVDAHDAIAIPSDDIGDDLESISNDAEAFLGHLSAIYIRNMAGPAERIRALRNSISASDETDERRPRWHVLTGEERDKLRVILDLLFKVILKHNGGPNLL